MLSSRYSLILIFLARTVGAQTSAAPPAYDPRLTFAPLTLPDPVTSYRSGNGAPGPAYWQNQADYELRAQLDTAAKELKTNEIITYTNNSPDTLPSLWLQLDQNIYKKDSRSKMVGGRRRRRNEEATPEKEWTDGFLFDSVEIEANHKTITAQYIVSDTRMQVRLAEPLKGHGGRLKILIHYHYQIPGVWGGRNLTGACPKRVRSTIWRNGTREWPFTMTCGVGTRCPISGPTEVLSRVRRLRLLHHGSVADADRGFG